MAALFFEDRVVVVTQNSVDPVAISRGVLVVHATWSGTSVACLQCWRTRTATIEMGRPWLSLMDSDHVSHGWAKRVLGRALGGGGEALWIRRGLIVHSMSGYGCRFRKI
jgi:hypothetical protein